MMVGSTVEYIPLGSSPFYTFICKLNNGSQIYFIPLSFHENHIILSVQTYPNQYYNYPSLHSLNPKLDEGKKYNIICFFFLKYVYGYVVVCMMLMQMGVNICAALL